MNSENNNNGTPRLRFPSFTEQWEEKPLSYFLHEHKTKSDGKCEVHSVSVTKGVINQVEYLGRSFAAADTSKYNLAKPNDIIYTKSPTGAFPYGIIKQNKNPYNVIVSPLYAVYTPINEHIGYILDSFFESPANTNNYLSSLVQKGAKNTIQISNDTFISKSVCLPLDPAEQEKIANFLLTIDTLIAAQGQKVETLKERKRGMMQQLFPQPGETAPRLRFPGFEGEWQEELLGNLCTISAGGDVPKQNFSKTKTEVYNIPIISNGIEENALYGYTNSPKITTEAVSVSARGTIGYAEYRDYPYYPIIRLLSVIPKNTQILNTKYLSYILSIQKYNVANAGIPQLTVPMISAVSIFFPTLAEQKKIAEYLFAFDDAITAEASKLDTLKAHKRGLMQQLFPQPSK